MSLIASDLSVQHPLENGFKLPPLALYVHIPWCIRKCPYCDFNSHAATPELPEQDYVTALLADLDLDLVHVHGRQLESIFFGGGTPSLFSAQAVQILLLGIEQRIRFSPTIEITLKRTQAPLSRKSLLLTASSVLIASQLVSRVFKTVNYKPWAAYTQPQKPLVR